MGLAEESLQTLQGEVLLSGAKQQRRRCDNDWRNHNNWKLPLPNARHYEHKKCGAVVQVSNAFGVGTDLWPGLLATGIDLICRTSLSTV